MNKPQSMAEQIGVDAFTMGYIAHGLTLSEEPGEDSGKFFADNIAPESLAEITADCAKFQADNGPLIVGREQEAGQDFWLTRQRHGAGFWDGSWDGDCEAGDKLTAAAHAFEQTDFYLGDDGKIYIGPG